ncbi:MBL fold metallo-hydrolase [Galactobacter valiniphilus]|uniref:MBL fold metallo-hydrolase n=1 Tax=Galactobacter valiniphilus TaxID=2676122 RepID=UPI003736B964
MSELDSPVAGVRVLRQDNPGPMTLEGTQSYVIAAPGGAVVIDPGDDDAAHQEALSALGSVALILVTHRHHDHVGGLPRLRELTGAPSRGAAAEFSVGAAPLTDGELIELGPGLALRVLATPGHTGDSISLVLLRDGKDVAVFTGDTILGYGTTIIDHPDGTLQDFLASLEALRALGPVETLPAHGGFPGPVDAIAQKYLEHRLMRLEQVRAAAAGLLERGLEPTVPAVTDVVYAEVDPSVRRAAEHTVSAQLALLARRGDI